MSDISVLNVRFQHADIGHSTNPSQKACRGISVIFTLSLPFVYMFMPFLYYFYKLLASNVKEPLDLEFHLIQLSLSVNMCAALKQKVDRLCCYFMLREKNHFS